MVQTLGQLLVNNILPGSMQAKAPLTKKNLDQRLYELARQNTPDAARKIEKLRALGHELSTTEGISATLDDIAPDQNLKNEFLRPALKQIAKIEDPGERRALLAKLQPQVIDAAAGHPGSFSMMVRSGARGKPVQLAKNVAAPVMSLQASGDPTPWLIHHSYAEGLRNSEAWATHGETRNNQIATRLSVVEPGDIGKILVSNMADQLITTEDCGTQNGIMVSVEDGNAADRYLAREEGKFSRNTLLTPQALSQMRKNGLKNILVRSPMTCEAHQGICQRCYGLNEYGKSHSIGTNVGIRSAQALSEPLTQFALSAKHGIRSTTTDKTMVQGHKGLRQLLDVPATFANKAALAPIDGTVDKVEKAPQGGHTIYVGQTGVYTPPGYPPIVKPGQRVIAGDQLTEGVPNPAEVVALAGLGIGRRQLVDQLQQVYKQQGRDLDRRHIELLTKSQLNRVRVDEDPSEKYYPGEVVEYNEFMRGLQEDAENVPLSKAEGRTLASNYLHYTAGTRLTPPVVNALKEAGVKDVQVPDRDIKITALMRPASRNPLLNPDWLARLGHRYLQESIMKGVHFGETSKLHGTHPVPALAYGAEFGEGEPGQY